MMANGSALPIEQVQPGDQVQCDNAPGDDDGQEAGLVYETYVAVTDAPLDLTLQVDGEIFTITTTPEHPFYIPATEEFVPAGSLTVGMCFAVAEGEATVELVDIQQRHEPTVVYNFHVLGAQNYFVQVGPDQPAVLVHNRKMRPAGWKPKPKKADKPAKQEADKPAKRGPKPWPHGPHNQTIQRRIDELKIELGADWEHTAGGPLTEEFIPTPFGKKNARRPDITFVVSVRQTPSSFSQCWLHHARV